MTQKSRYFLIAAAAVLILGVGGGLIAYLASKRAASLPAGIPAEVRYVPADAALVAYADVRAVMSSELRRELMPTIETGARKGRQMMSDFAGIDVEKQVDHVLGYVERSAAQAPDTSEAPRAVMLVQGTFEQARIEQFIRDHKGTVENYHGHSISLHQKGEEEMAVGFVRPDLLAVGQSSLVRRVLDLSNDTSGKTQDLTANTELMTLIRDASGSTAWVVGHFDALSRGMKLPASVSRQVPPLRLVSAKANVNGGIKATIRADTADQPAAEQLREVVRAFVALARLHGGGKSELQSALKSIQLSGTDKTVQMTFAISSETVRALAPRPNPNPNPNPEPGTQNPEPRR